MLTRSYEQGTANFFTAHLRESGESYERHLRFTVGMSARILLTGIILLIHGIFPFLLTKSTSGRIAYIYNILQARVKRSQAEGDVYDFHI